MHSMRCENGWIAHYNSDFSGKVKLVYGEHVAEVPFSVLEELVAEKIRGERMTALEDATTRELLS